MYHNDDYTLNRLNNTLCESLRGEVNLNYITNDLIVFSLDYCDDINILLDKIRVLLKPKEMEQNDLYKYLYLIHEMLSHNVITNYFYVVHFNKIDKNCTPDNLYRLMQVIKYYNYSTKYNDFLGNLGIVTLIIGYLYANNIDDYTMLYNFLNNPNYFYEKLILSGVKFDYDELNEFNILPYEHIYQSIEKLLYGTKDKKIIK